MRIFIELVFEFNDLFLQDLRLGRGVVELISLFFELFAFAQDLLNARAVFSLQGIYLGDALFDVARLPLVELGSAQNAAHFRRDVVQFYAHRVEAFDERAERGFVVAHARKLLHRRRNLLHRAAFAAQSLLRRGKRGQIRLEIVQLSAQGVKLFFLALFEAGVFDLAYAKVEIFPILAGYLIIFGNFALIASILRAKLLLLFQSLFERVAREFVHDAKVLLGIEKAHRFMLPVNVREERRKLFEHGKGDFPAVDAANARPVFRHEAREHQLPFLFYPVFVQKPLYLGSYLVEIGKDARRLFAVSDQTLVRARAQDKVYAVDDDGFARARLAGENVQPLAELHFQLVYERNVFYR